jgi:hypothetical protein
LLDSKTELEKDSFVLFLNTKFLISPASALDADKADKSVATGIRKFRFFKVMRPQILKHYLLE